MIVGPGGATKLNDLVHPQDTPENSSNDTLLLAGAMATDSSYSAKI